MSATIDELNAAQRAYYQRVLAGRARVKALAGDGLAEMSLEVYRPAHAPPPLTSADLALDKLYDGEPLGPLDVKALEALVRDDRPVFEIQHGTFPPVDPPWHQIESARRALEDAIRCVGRIDLLGHPTLQYGGTGVLVGPDTLLTNRHVARLFVQGLGERVALASDVRARFDTWHELDNPKADPIDIVEALLIHPYWDIAVLRVRNAEDRPFLPLLGDIPTSLEQRPIAVIGYPAFDSRNDARRQMDLFRGVFGCKRLAPGTLMDRQQMISYGRSVNALTHDASTLGGNSGSAVIDLETGKLLGVHFAGIEREANFAVPAWELGLDQRVRGKRVMVQPKPAEGAKPPAEQEEAWSALQQGTVELPGLQPAGSGRTEALSPFEWYERQDDASLAEALRTSPEITQARLIAAVGEQEAAEIKDWLQPPPVEEGLFDPEPDASLPEVILLHGIMGAHLEHRGASTLRVWLSAQSLFFRDVPERLALSGDGATDRRKDQVLAPGPHLELAYGRAARTLRRARFVVHPVSYDWRKGIEAAAERLGLHLELLAHDRPGKRFMLVGHSMGGLVATCWARQTQEWRSKWSKLLVRAVFAGSPLGGSYAPIEAIRGTYPLFEKLAWVTSLGADRAKTLLAFREAAATMPGLVDMLPNPDLFPDAAPFYTRAGWGAGVAPEQWLLEQSRRLKGILVDSPIFDRTTLLVSLGHGTVASMGPGALETGPRAAIGDGTVPARAAALEGLTDVYQARWEHSELLREPAVLQAVIGLAKEGRCALPRVTEEVLKAAVLEAPVEVPDAVQARAKAIRARAESGALTGEDVRWVLRG